MRIFADTSAWIAYFNRDDDFHLSAKEFLDSEPSLVTSNIVLHETVALLENRIDEKTAEKAAGYILNPFIVELIIISENAEKESLKQYKEGTRKISFVDWTNAVLMGENNINKIFAFDKDFEKMGFVVLPQS